MHKRAELNGILVDLSSLSVGKNQQWLEAQDAPQTREQATAQKRVRRLIRLSKEEEAE